MHQHTENQRATQGTMALMCVQATLRFMGVLGGVAFVVIGAFSPRGVSAEPLSIDDVVDARRLTGSVPGSPVWSPDSRWLAFAGADGESGSRELWVVSKDGTQPSQVTRRPSKKTGGISAFAWLSDGSGLIFVRDGDLWRTDREGLTPKRLTREGGVSGRLAVSPKGMRIAYLRAGDLWTIGADGSKARRMTKLAMAGPSKVGLGVYARRDREIGPATWASGTPVLAWSPDGRWLAVHVVDRRRLRQVPFPYYLGDETAPNLMRRTYPGDRNELRTIVLVDARSGRQTKVALPAPASMYVVNMQWSITGTLLIDRMSDDNTRRQIHTLQPGGKPKQAWQDDRATRIYTQAASTWAADGQKILMTADLDDRYRIYALAPGQKAPEALTPKDVDAVGAAMPLPDGTVLYAAQAPTPEERQIWRAGGKASTRITRRVGSHRARASPDGQMLATIASDDVTPPELWLIPLANQAATPIKVAGGASSQLTAAQLAKPRYVRFRGPDEGDMLHAKVYLPAAARGDRVPVLFGPIYVNTVRNRWDGRWGLLQQLLVQRGYAVIQVDVRGSTGYGRAFREKFLFEWGGRDLDDLAAAKAWLQTQAWADTKRVGVFGSSYGGLVAVYAMLKRPGLFDAAVAGAPATDPRFFGSDDVAIVRTPKSHPAAFERRAARDAGALSGPLMMIHGLMDDVVPFKTTAELAEALMVAGKDFELVVAPGATHRWTARPHHARYLLNKLTQFFERHVPVNAPTTAPQGAQ